MILNSVKILSLKPGFILEKQSTSLDNILSCCPRNDSDCQMDWNNSDIDMKRLIDVSNKPFRGAYCNFEGSEMTIWEAILVEEKENFFT